jgi:hypothetical protein
MFESGNILHVAYATRYIDLCREGHLEAALDDLLLDIAYFMGIDTRRIVRRDILIKTIRRQYSYLLLNK